MGCDAVAGPGCRFRMACRAGVSYARGVSSGARGVRDRRGRGRKRHGGAETPALSALSALPSSSRVSASQALSPSPRLSPLPASQALSPSPRLSALPASPAALSRLGSGPVGGRFRSGDRCSEAVDDWRVRSLGIGGTGASFPVAQRLWSLFNNIRIAEQAPSYRLVAFWPLRARLRLSRRSRISESDCPICP